MGKPWSLACSQLAGITLAGRTNEAEHRNRSEEKGSLAEVSGPRLLVCWEKLCHAALAGQPAPTPPLLLAPAAAAAAAEMASLSGADTPPDWGALLGPAVARVVEHASRLPRHQAHASVSALRLTSRHWRSAVDDAIRSWLTQPSGGSSPGHVAAVLRRWQHLEALTLDSCVVDETVLQALARCRRLRQLTSTISVRYLLPGAAARRLWEVVGSLPALQSLTVHAAREGPSPAGLAALAACTSLTELELENFYPKVRLWPGLRGACKQAVAAACSTEAAAAQTCPCRPSACRTLQPRSWRFCGEPHACSTSSSTAPCEAQAG